MEHIEPSALTASQTDPTVLSSGGSCYNYTEPAELEACQQANYCHQFISKDVNSTVFSLLCSVLREAHGLQQHQLGEHQTQLKPSSFEVWGYGLLCVSLISLTSVVGVAILPLMSKQFYSSLLTGLIGLAVGSLSGSALFHLIPSAMRLSEVSFYPHHSYLPISMTVWLGIYMFFILERFLKICMDSKARGQGLPRHNHSHLPGGEQASLVKNSRQFDSVNSEDHKLSVEDEKGSTICQENRQAIEASFGHMDKPQPNSRPTVEDVKSLTGPGNRIATVAWMIIFGDGIHNFIDGLSIGAAFSQSILTGISVSVAVLCEEFPHELGDFAVLLNAGMSMKEALVYNFLSACTCYLGLVLGIILGELNANCYVFALAGGMFLYISLVDMVPEMNESTEQASKMGVVAAVKVFVIQNVGVVLGIACLYTLARFQDEIAFGA